MTYQHDNRVALENDKPRLEMVEKVTGKAKFTTDYYLPNMLWAAYLRSPHGRVRIRTAQLEQARAVPGVVEVEMTGQQGRYHGDRIGHIVAESHQALLDGIAALRLRVEQSRPRTRLEEEHTPLEELDPPNNLQAAEQALAQSDIVEQATYQTQVQTHCCMEPHAAVVDYRGDSAVAYGSTQSNFGMRDELARELGLRPEQVLFNCEHVGGGFGSKLGGGPEGALAARMSRKYNRPCRVVCDRKEEQLDTGNRPGSLQYMRIGVARDGSIRGGRIATWGSVGPAGGGGGVRNPSRYRFGTVATSHQDVHLDGGFPRAMRAPGHPQAMFAIELMMDRLAAKLDMDPVAFRTINETSDVRREMFKAGAELIGWNNRQPDGQWPGIIKRGYGVGVGDWGNGPGRANVAINIHRNGTIEVLSGAQDIGTGFRTLLGDVVRTHLGLPRELFTVRVGRSDYPWGPASGGSVTSRFVAPRAFVAADMARDAIFKLVAEEWNLDNPATLSMTDGVIRHGERRIEWAQACRLMNQDQITVNTAEQGDYWKRPTGSEAVQFAEADVDTETGIIHVRKIIALQEVGLPVNRSTVENQITGAVIQGISFTLFEDRILNRQTGSMVNANMDMYKIAGSKDIPEIVPIIWRSREDVSVNSLGEPPSVPICGAIACAVANAIGVQVRTMPLTPARVLAALEEKERA